MPPIRHDRAGIIGRTLRLLDDIGLPDLSMRRLASELDVQPSALYWHFPNKQALLAAVAERILAAVPEPDAARPVDEVAHVIRDALLAYRDGAEVVMSTYALQLDGGRAQRALAASLPDVPDRAVLSDAVFEFILGHATLLQQRMHAQSIGAVDASTADPSPHAGEVFTAGIRSLASAGARMRD